MLKLIYGFYKEITRNIFRYLGLFIVSEIIIVGICIPIFTFLGSIALRIANVPYLSNTNLVSVLTTKPFLDIVFLLLLVAILIAIYWQVTFLILGIFQISSGNSLTIRPLLKLSVSRVQHTFVQSVWFLLIYTILILPFGGMGFSTPLLSKVKIPSFLIDYVFHDHPLLLAGLITIYVVTFYLGIRFILVLPLMIGSNVSIRKAIPESWHKTGKRFIKIAVNFLALAVSSSLISAIALFAMVLFQSLWDGMAPTGIAYFAATFNLLIIEAGLLFLNIGLGVAYIMVMINELSDDTNFNRNMAANLVVLREGESPAQHKVLTRIGFVIVIAGALGFNVLYLNGFFNSDPITISHRGVNDGNGVQNTIPSLKNTSRLHPNFVEMDIHETKDHKFVVMHDENLKVLTGVNKAPYQLTLKQLTDLTASENGAKAHVASFDDYFNTAHKLKQRLIIEIKTTPHDDPKMVERFNKEYSKRILAYHDEIHTLDYNVVQTLKKINPKLTVGYILPFNFIGVPQSRADFYTMEYSTLNTSFLINAQISGKQVYAWTVNDDNAMSKMNFMGVDGIITDKLEDLQQNERDLNNKPSFTQRLLNFVVENN